MTGKSPAGKPLVGSGVRSGRGSTAEALWAVEQRLADTERELRVQFTRIAQLQAELDVLVANLRRATDAHAMRLAGECVQWSSGLQAVQAIGTAPRS